MKNVITNMKIERLDEEIIEKERLFNVYVFGLPRSGTSMTTKIVELLGVNMIYTSEEKKEQTDERFKRNYGEYHANPTGFFEITDNMLFNFLRILSKPYSGCKMIVPVMNIRWELVKTFASKVILMKREPEEIRQSQMAYYRKNNIPVATIRSFWANEEERLKRNSIEFIDVWYNEVLKKPEKEVERIRTFIKSSNRIDDALEFINPNQNRFKKDSLIDGI
jgi:hypothetical protein